MEILGIGPMELILILIVALMVFGPDKLPQIGAKLGRAMRDMRKATRAISEEINATRDAVEKPARELAEPFQEVAGMAKTAGAVAAAARNPGAALRDSVMKELNPPAKAEGQEAPATDAPAEADAVPADENRIAPPGLTETTAPVETAAPFVPTLLPPVVAASDAVLPTAEPAQEDAPADDEAQDPDTNTLPPTYPPPEQ